MKVSGLLCGFVILVGICHPAVSPLLYLKKKKTEHHHTHRAKRCFALFMDEFIT